MIPERPNHHGHLSVRPDRDSSEKPLQSYKRLYDGGGYAVLSTNGSTSLSGALPCNVKSPTLPKLSNFGAEYAFFFRFTNPLL